MQYIICLEAILCLINLYDHIVHKNQLVSTSFCITVFNDMVLFMCDHRQWMYNSSADSYMDLEMC